MSSFVIQLSAVTSTGNITQIYLPDVTAGDGTGASGSQKRSPAAGWLFQAEVMPDGINGGTIEIWDLSGEDCGADVDTGVIITDAQKNVAAALTPSKARLIYTQVFAGSGTADNRAEFIVPRGVRINFGLAARFIGGAGSCKVNFDVEDCFKKVWIAGTV